MLSIRFLRQGKLHQPSYKIVVTEKTRPPKSGKFIEQLGSYNPKTKEKILNPERIKYWISKGAQPSNTIHNLLIKNKIIQGVRVAVHSVKKKKGDETVAAQQPVVESLKAEAPKAPETPVAEPLKQETPKQEVIEQEIVKEEVKPETPEQPISS